MHHLIFLIALLPQPSPLYVISPDFANGGSIPATFTCDGEDFNPTLIVNGIPEGAESLVLIAEDADSPIETLWLVWNIPPVETINQNSFQELDEEQQAVKTSHYRGPCPVNGSTQRYVFKVYALDTMLSLKPDAQRAEVEMAMNDHILAKGELRGKYSRPVLSGRKGK